MRICSYKYQWKTGSRAFNIRRSKCYIPFVLQFFLNFSLHVIGANKISLVESSSFLIFSTIDLFWNHYVDIIVSQFENQKGQNVPGNGKKHPFNSWPTNNCWLKLFQKVYAFHVYPVQNQLFLCIKSHQKKWNMLLCNHLEWIIYIYIWYGWCWTKCMVQLQICRNLVAKCWWLQSLVKR